MASLLWHSSQLKPEHYQQRRGSDFATLTDQFTGRKEYIDGGKRGNQLTDATSEYSDLRVINLDGLKRSDLIRLVVDAMVQAGKFQSDIDGFLENVKNASYAKTVANAIVWEAPLRFVKNGEPWVRGDWKRLSPWQRFRRKRAVRRGIYEHPDGTLEFDTDVAAGVDPRDSKDVQEAKIEAYERKIEADERRQVRPESRVWKAITYIWRVLVNVFYVAVVVYVLQRTNQKDPNLTVIIATLGLVYTVIRSIAIGQFNATLPMFVNLSKTMDEIKEAIGAKRSMVAEDYVATEQRMQTVQIKLMIEGLFLAIVNLICLFALFVSL